MSLSLSFSAPQDFAAGTAGSSNSARVANRMSGAYRLLQLREDAHWHNRDHILRVVSEGGSWCFVSPCCYANIVHAIFSPLCLLLDWRCRPCRYHAIVSLLWFAQYGMGRAHRTEKTLPWRVAFIVSSSGRIRLCERNEAATCQ